MKLSSIIIISMILNLLLIQQASMMLSRVEKFNKSASTIIFNTKHGSSQKRNDDKEVIDNYDIL